MKAAQKYATFLLLLWSNQAKFFFNRILFMLICMYKCTCVCVHAHKYIYILFFHLVLFFSSRSSICWIKFYNMFLLFALRLLILLTFTALFIAFLLLVGVAAVLRIEKDDKNKLKNRKHYRLYTLCAPLKVSLLCFSFVLVFFFLIFSLCFCDFSRSFHFIFYCLYAVFFALPCSSLFCFCFCFRCRYSLLISLSFLFFSFNHFTYFLLCPQF